MPSAQPAASRSIVPQGMDRGNSESGKNCPPTIQKMEAKKEEGEI